MWLKLPVIAINAESNVREVTLETVWGLGGAPGMCREGARCPAWFITAPKLGKGKAGDTSTGTGGGLGRLISLF